jgi:serine protease AprX
MTETDFDQQEVSTARTEIRRLLGSELAGKASDAFCVTIHRRSTRPAAFELEAIARPGAAAVPVATVVEFGEATTISTLPRLTERQDWPELSRTVEALGSATPTGGPISAPAVLRQAMIAAIRNQSYQVVSPAYDEIERLSGSLLRPEPEVLGTPQIPTLVTQVCWLNRTVRTWAGPQALAEVAADPAVTGVDVPRRIMADADTPNHIAIGFPAFFQQTSLTGANITVAVIDSEVASNHPALKGRIVHRRNYTAEAWGNPNSHGTAVAGIIAGDDPFNGGLAPDCTIYNYKVLATNRLFNSDDFGGALAIQQALEDGIDVANCSWGAGPTGPTPSREARAADAAWSLGMTIVKSAGNGGPGPSTMTTPADAQGIIVVGAMDDAGTAIQDYSSRGPAGAKPGPDFAAPGGSTAEAIACCLLGGGFGDAGIGTSFAAPHVSGLLALLLQRDPNLVPDQLRQQLRQSARPLFGVSPAAQGSGLVWVGD